MGFQTAPGKRGIVSSRFDETFGLAVASAFIQEEYNNELVVEATWRIQVNGMFSVQPDLQYIIHPGGAVTSGNVLLFSVHTEIGF